jgi:hypothetical protein
MNHACSGAALADAALIWANCRAYNAGDPGLLQACDAAEADFARRWAAAGLPTGARIEHATELAPLQVFLSS